MSAANADVCFAFTEAQEGTSFVDNPADPGGATCRGITFREFLRFYPKATIGDLKAITPATVRMIWDADYWYVMACAELPAGPDLMVSDFGFNGGPGLSVRYLQVVAGVKQDGVNGPITQAAVAKMPATDVITRLNGLQLAHYQALPTFGVFGAGWTARSERRLKAALAAVPSTRSGATA